MGNKGEKSVTTNVTLAPAKHASERRLVIVSYSYQTLNLDNQ